MSKEVAKRADGKSAPVQSQTERSLSSLVESDSQSPVHQLLRLQGRAGNQAVRTLLGSGRPLADPVRGEMETRFGADFRDVRIHDNPLAHRSAKLLRAKAFTYGSDIVFGAGRFTPGRQEGRYLLAHELAHVVQQSGRSPAPLSEARISRPEDPAERAADHAALASDAQTTVLVQPISRLPTLARAEESPLPWETAVETADEWWGKTKATAYTFLIDSIRKIKRERIAELRGLARAMPASVQRIAEPLIDAYEVALDILSSFVLGLVGLAVGLVSGIVHAVWGIATGLLNLAYMIGAFISGFVDEQAREEFNNRAGAFLEGLKQLGPNLVRLLNAWKKEFDKASPEKQSLMIGELTGQIEAMLLQALAGGKIAGSMPPLKIPARAFAFAGGITRGGGTALSINVAGPGMAAALPVNMASQIEQKATSSEKKTQTETAQTTKVAPKTKPSNKVSVATSSSASRTSAEWLKMRGNPEYTALGMKVFRGRFSETLAMKRLWKLASHGCEQSDAGYDNARKRFWKLIATSTDDDARLIRAILEDAGYETPMGRAAKVKMTWSTKLDPKRLAKLEKSKPDVAAKLRMSAEEARRGRTPEGLQGQQRKESIEHAIPRHPAPGSAMAKKAAKYPTRFLDPANLRLENLYENMLMGNKPSAK